MSRTAFRNSSSPAAAIQLQLKCRNRATSITISSSLLEKTQITFINTCENRRLFDDVMIPKISRHWARTISRLCQPLMAAQTTKSFPATFYRGGTSNGLLINATDLPTETAKWGPILSSAMGSPDHYGRQLNGMGLGISSTSKVMVVSASTREDVDLEYTFVQVGIKDGSMDVAGNCGNMSSAVGPFGVDEGLVRLDDGREVCGNGDVTVRMWNSNTKKTVHSTSRVRNAAESERRRYEPCGDYSIDGVPGTGSKITLAFIDPAGSKSGKALPTGNAIDMLTLPDGEQVQASLTDVANPGVFVLASDLGLSGTISPDELGSRTDVMTNLEHLRQQGAEKMGLDPSVQSIPKIVLISSPSEDVAARGINIVCRALSMQQAHRAVPLTLALNLGVACRISGTLAANAASGLTEEGRESTVTIAHASGVLQVGSVTGEDGRVESALLHRTARSMMKGEVFYVQEE